MAGQRRMDAAIDHFAPMGYNKADVRKVINGLLKVYGKKGWLLLEDNCYHVVQEALFEKQEQEEKMLLLQQEEEEEEEEEAQPVPEEEQQQQEWEEDDEDQQQEAAMMGAPSGNDMPIVEVQYEVPCETALAVEKTEEVVPMIIGPPAPEAASPHPAATGSGRTRRPCYGWISESESDSDYEESLASRNTSCMSQVQEETFLKESGRVDGM